METANAIKWVDDHKRDILRKAEMYVTYAPYCTEDYLQDAYEAAILAAKVVTDDLVAFEKVFRNFHRQIIFKVTPYPEEDRPLRKSVAKDLLKAGVNPDTFVQPKKVRSGSISMSYPANRRAFVPLHQIEMVAGDAREEIDLQAAYARYAEPTLSKTEKAAMELALGFGVSGSLTSREIGVALGIEGGSVRNLITRAIDKTRANVQSLKKVAQPELDFTNYAGPADSCLAATV